MRESRLLADSIDAVGETGEYPVFSPPPLKHSCDGTGETGVRVDSVTFFQLAVLDADDDARVTSGAGRRSGIMI